LKGYAVKPRKFLNAQGPGLHRRSFRVSDIFDKTLEVESTSKIPKSEGLDRDELG
uniref:Movement protein n=1 Tax=Anisakis simplex TaxID=6269 RepID=A0A0M3KGX3_ANISI